MKITWEDEYEVEVAEVEELEVEEEDYSDFWEAYQEMQEQRLSNYDFSYVVPLKLQSYSLSPVGLFQLTFNKPIIEPPIRRKGRRL